MDEKRRITLAAAIMSVATIISRILGFIRDIVFAFFFGATGLSDTFVVAFRIPNLLRELFAEGSMSAAFIPVLAEYQKKEGPEGAQRLVRTAFTFILTVVGGITAVGIIFAPELVSMIAPGFTDMPEKFSITVLLTRIMFPFLLFISLAALTMGALNTKRVFFIPALAPAFLNVSIIASIALLYRHFESPIVAAAFGVALGGLLQYAVQVYPFLRHGYSMRPDFGFGHPGLRKIGLLVLPATLGMAVSQINIFVSNIIASFLPGGSMTYLFYSMHLIQFPVGVFGVAMGMAVMPSLSGHALKRDYENLRDDFSFALRLLFFITVPAMAGLIALSVPIVSTLFQRGAFDYAATAGTANALVFYALGIWSMVGSRVIAATFYSMQNTKTPVKVAALALLTNIALSLALVKPMGYAGLALSNALSSMLNFTALFFLFRKEMGRVDARRIIRSFMKFAAASAVMGIVGWYALKGNLWGMHGMALAKALYLSGGILLCAGVYALMTFLFKAEELTFMVNLLRSRFKR